MDSVSSRLNSPMAPASPQPAPSDRALRDYDLEWDNDRDKIRGLVLQSLPSWQAYPKSANDLDSPWMNLISELVSAGRMNVLTVVVEVLQEEWYHLSFDLIGRLLFRQLENQYRWAHCEDTYINPIQVIEAFLVVPDIKERVEKSEWLAYFNDRQMALLGCFLEHFSKAGAKDAHLFVHAMASRWHSFRDNPPKTGEVNPFVKIPNATENDTPEREAFLLPLLKGKLRSGFRFALAHGASPYVKTFGGLPLFFLIGRHKLIPAWEADDYKFDFSKLSDASLSYLDFCLLQQENHRGPLWVRQALEEGCSIRLEMVRERLPEWIQNSIGDFSLHTRNILIASELLAFLGGTIAPEDHQNLHALLYKERGSYSYCMSYYWRTVIAECDQTVCKSLLELVAADGTLPSNGGAIADDEKTLRSFLKRAFGRDPFQLWVAFRLLPSDPDRVLRFSSALVNLEGEEKELFEIIGLDGGARRQAIGDYLSNGRLKINEYIATLFRLLLLQPPEINIQELLWVDRYEVDGRPSELTLSDCQGSTLWEFDVVVEEYYQAIVDSPSPLETTCSFLNERLSPHYKVSEELLRYSGIYWEGLKGELAQVTNGSIPYRSRTVLETDYEREPKRESLDQSLEGFSLVELRRTQLMVGSLVQILGWESFRKKGWLMLHRSDGEDSDLEYRERERLAGLAPNRRRVELLSAVDELARDFSLTAEQTARVLCTLENIALFHKVSNLADLAVYDPRLPYKDSHAFTQSAVVEQLKSLANNELIFPVSDLEAITEGTIASSIKEKGHGWLVVRHSPGIHLTLLLATFDGEKGKIYLFDSVGIVPEGRESEERFLANITSRLGEQLGSQDREYSRTARQYDESLCGAFVIADFIEALKLLNEGNPLFTEGQYAPDFFKVNQWSKEIHNPRIQLADLRSYRLASRIGNLKALRISMKILRGYLNNRVEYPDNSAAETG